MIGLGSDKKARKNTLKNSKIPLAKYNACWPVHICYPVLTRPLLFHTQQHPHKISKLVAKMGMKMKMRMRITLVPIHDNDYMMIIHGLNPRKISKMDEDEDEDEDNCGPLPALVGNN